jgi:hypothetical protein
MPTHMPMNPSLGKAYLVHPSSISVIFVALYAPREGLQNLY